MTVPRYTPIRRAQLSHPARPGNPACLLQTYLGGLGLRPAKRPACMRHLAKGPGVSRAGLTDPVQLYRVHGSGQSWPLGACGRAGWIMVRAELRTGLGRWLRRACVLSSADNGIAALAPGSGRNTAPAVM
jgi:hypothetical protein